MADAQPSIQLTENSASTGSRLREENGRWTGYRHLLGAHFKQIRREPGVVFWLFLFPVLMALGLGFAFRNRTPDVPSIAIGSGPGAQDALDFIKRSTTGTPIHAQVVNPAEATRGFRFGKYDLVIEPTGKGTFQYRYDPARPQSVLSRNEADDALQSGAGRKNPVLTLSVASSEPGARYIDFVIPGLLGMTLMNSGMWGLGFVLVDMRARKLLKRYLATPVHHSHFLLALASSRIVLVLVEVLLLLGIGTLVFHMPVLGSIGSIFVMVLIASTSFGGLGLLIASRVDRIEIASGLANLVMLPMWIFSGVFFSYERFPAVLQPLIKGLPLTAANDALRSIILEGASLASQSNRLIVLVVWAVVCFLVAIKWFRWN